VKRAITWILVGASVIACFALIASVPPLDDEFVHYRPIYCVGSADAAQLPNSFCFDWELRPPGSPRFFQLRAHQDVGFTPALLYLPVHRVWSDPRAARALGVASLLLFAYLLKRLTKLPGHAAALLALFNLPLAYQMIFDTGPVAFQLVTILLVAWGVPRMRRSWHGVALGLALFIAIDHKPFFAVVLPATLVLTAAALLDAGGEPRRELRRWLRALGGLLAAFAIPTALLLTSIDHSGRRYLASVLRHLRPVESDGAAGLLGRLIDFRRFFVDHGNFSHRVYVSSADWDPATILYWLLGAALLGTAAWIVAPRAWRSKPRAALVQLMLALVATGAALAGVVNTREAWAGQHLVLVMPFLLVTFGVAARELLARHPRPALALLASMALCQAAVGLQVPGRDAHVGGRSEEPVPERFERMGELELIDEMRRPENQERYFYLVTDRGILDSATLYGGEETRVYDLRNANRRIHRKRLEELARSTGRKPAFLVRDSLPTEVRQLYPRIQPVFPEDGKAVWQLWSPHQSRRSTTPIRPAP